MNFSSEADPSAIKTEPSTEKQIPNELQAFLQEQISPDNQKFQEIQAVVEKAERSPIFRESSPSGTFASSRRHTKFLDPGNRRLYSLQDIRERDPEFIVGRKASLMFQIRYDNTRERRLFPKAKLIEESIRNLRPKDSRKESDNNMRNRNNNVKIVIHKDLETTTTEPEEKQETLFDPQEFLMIKPITKEPISPHPDNLDLKKILTLDQNLFSIEIVNYASSLSDENIKQNLKNLVEFLASNPDKNQTIDDRDPKQDIICSITLKPEDLSTLRDLLVGLLENLKEEPLSLKLKYKDEISCIETKFSKSTGSSIYNRASVSAVASKFREQEFEDLKASIETLLKEECFISSKEALAATHQFLLKIFEKFSQVNESGDYKSNEEIMIDYVTLPKLLERVLDPSETIFTERLIIYTYDLYLSSLNLMTYLIYNFFHLKPSDSSVIDLTDLDPNHQRSRVLDLIQFWLEERDEDFVLDPILSLLLKVFLDYYIQSEKENKENHLLYEVKIINSQLESTLNRVPKPKNVTFLDPVNTHEESEIANGVKKLSEKNTSVATSPSISFSKEFLLCGLVGAVNKSSVHSNWKSLSPVKNVKGYLEEKNGLDCYLLIDRSPDDIARQLTLIDSKLFSQVNIREVIKMRWTKMDRHPCPAYLQYVSHFNDFSFWLQYTVLSLQSQYDQICLLKKFIDVALLCKYSYRNYSAPHYIYAALVSLENFGVISFQEHLTEEFEELRTIFAPEENYVRLYEIIFRNIELPAVPSLIFFLKIFLKLQEGVTFKVKLPESKGDYLKFSTILQIQNYCSEMKRFQKTGYNRIIKKEKRLYNYLKNKFREEMPSDLESHETKMKTLVEMVNRSKQTRRSLLDYLFGFGRKKISI